MYVTVYILKIINHLFFKLTKQEFREFEMTFSTFNQDHVMEDHADGWHVTKNTHVKEDHVEGQHVIWNFSSEDYVNGRHVTKSITAEDHGDRHHVTDITVA